MVIIEKLQCLLADLHRRHVQDEAERQALEEEPSFPLTDDRSQLLDNPQILGNKRNQKVSRNKGSGFYDLTS